MEEPVERRWGMRGMTWHHVLCGLWLGIVLYQDVRYRRIPNWITVPAAAGGILFHTLSAGLLKGAIPSLEGAGAGLLLLLFPFVLGLVGGGDVKLMCAAGAWFGPQDIVYVFLFGSVFGGVMALAVMVPDLLSGTALFDYLGRRALAFQNMATRWRSRGLPYSVPMALAACSCFLMGVPE